MQRTYLALAGLALAGAGLSMVQPRLAMAAGLFQTTEVDADRFAVLARPVGNSEWTLLVLEQLATQPSCWQARPDGLVDPTLNRFDYTGICNRYLDSNGYSLRVADQDLGTTYRLQVQQVGSRLELQAVSPSNAAVLVVGRAEVPRRDRDGFVSLTLEPGWDLKRRTYEQRSLSHLYFASPAPLEQLIARAGGAQTFRRPPGRAELPGIAASLPLLDQRDDSSGSERSGRAIALQVIPYTEANGGGL
ncbi:DUF3747 domain-containing protein [Cyanobium sp. Cruz CV13-4-11]|jgi:hypothetical protein|uniref:DUF3747 domain-containing protein n=1 Tax=unclassified Cyanobium TaxID=2627006 RepID=UPI0020CCC43F|nr:MULTISPECIES: DUF3747 domain-containing protein [unclassified Cyanobium]MCP9899616.1 DUF3747 domain-containing protein [Cyanobium sp. Cruz CV11-17]MCP9918437.1 DUF3747 domain-containing protein [Cyanobium sp. Cruz CV13-4-11]